MIDLAEVRELLETNSDRVLSVYLRTDNGLRENQANTPAWRIALKNGLSDIEDRVDDDEAWQQIRAQTDAFFEKFEPSSKGLVMFVSPDTQSIHELPLLPAENEVHYGNALVGPLIWLQDEYEPYLVVLVDQEEAHVLTSYLGNLEAQEAMASERFTYDFTEKTLMPRPSGTQGDAGSPVTHGSNRDRFEDKMDEYIARFHRDVAQRIREWLRDHGDRRVVLGGSPTAAHAVEELLHEDVKKHLVSVISIPMHLNDSEVMERIQPVGLEYEREQEYKLVEDVINKAKAHGGRGALGQDEVEKAMEFGQVELLVLSWSVDDSEERNDLLLTALNNGVQVEFVHGAASDLLENEGGIAARLYYAVQEAE